MGIRELFNTHQEEIWLKLSKELEGEFQDKEGSAQDRIRVKVGDWAVTLDVHSEPGYRSQIRYTRFRAPYVNADGFRFNIYRDSIFGEIAKHFSHEVVTTGFPEIDSNFTVKANNPEKVKQLCAGSRLRALIQDEKDVHLFVRDSDGWFADEFPQGVDELVLEVEGEITDADRIKRLYVLFAAVLQRLCAIGSAYEDDPHVDV